MRFPILAAFVLFASITAQAQSSKFKKPNPAESCYQIAKTTAAFSTLSQSQFLVGTLQDTLMVSENDILGDGALVAIKTAKGTFVIYEGNDVYPLAQYLEETRKKAVAINKRCLHEVTSRDAEHEISGLASLTMRVGSRAFQVLELTRMNLNTDSKREFSCTRDDEADDWVISGELGARSINLFDNDHDSEFTLKYSKGKTLVYSERADRKNFIRVEDQGGGKARAVYFTTGEKDRITFNCSVE